ncbi:hypothetical protein IWW52_005960 [Coemansia sp. RSA 2704]|nr:hypothetical protein IWW52_005960 [Coemansia sp. RSA 2704]
MSLFGNLPPPLETENDEEVTGHQPEPKENSSRSWARPELVPNLRRPKVAAKPRSSFTQPKGPAALISRWESAAVEDDRPCTKASASKQPLPKSLAEFLPPPAKQGTFNPAADYNPAMPNNYQEYVHWIECRQVRDQAQPVDDGSSSEREGERLNPSSD